LLKAGEIQPEGWILRQLNDDLKEGYVGRYDQVHPTVARDVFKRQDRTSKRLLTPRKEWWSGEHEGYWKDAVLRMAFLTGDTGYLERSEGWIRELMDHRGKDGYIGIYAEGPGKYTRFNHHSGNGELWATSRILMAMLAYYEFTDEARVLEAVAAATQLVMEKYRDKNYFFNQGKGGGVSHGIGFFEILEWLYRLTSEKAYMDFSVKLYEDFNQGRARDDDLKTGLLTDPERMFRKHGAHVAEGLFVPQWIASITGDPGYEHAAGKVLEKLEYHLTPGGAMRCDEWIKGKRGTADERYEYCGIAEMISPLNKMITMNGLLSQADWLERMTFNAGQGARFPVLKGLSYLTTDNRIRINHRELGGREAYDAAHFAAVCCALNGGRLMPYFVEGMWVRDASPAEGITAMLFGPSRVRTPIRGVMVTIRESTGYPFSDHIRFGFEPERPVEFSFSFRKPFGVPPSELILPEGAEKTEEDDRITIRHIWKKNDTVEVRFPFPVEEVDQPPSKTVPEKGSYLRRGPLVYALPFDYQAQPVKRRGKGGFYKYRIKAAGRRGWEYRLPTGDPFRFNMKTEGNGEDPWIHAPVTLQGTLINKKKQAVPVELVPMGTTLFRRVTFPVTYIPDPEETNTENNE